MFTNKKRGGIDTFVRAVPLSVAETSNVSIKDQQPQLPVVPFGIAPYGFVGQTFSKQLYVLYLVRPNVSPPHKEA